jgi:hypothetical protein
MRKWAQASSNVKQRENQKALPHPAGLLVDAMLIRFEFLLAFNSASQGTNRHAKVDTAVAHLLDLHCSRNCVGNVPWMVGRFGLED